MTYKQIKNLREKEFQRLCGVKPQLFHEMVEELKKELPKPRQRGGQPKLRIEDRLLIALEYWREYRTYFHIAHSWGIHESTVCRIVHQVEDTLIKSQRFSLRAQKSTLRYRDRMVSSADALRPSRLRRRSARTRCVDVAESPIERPKKNSEITTVVKAMQRGQRGFPP